jgi:hypothetical protein
VFGGEIANDGEKNAYDILAHIVRAADGQSGSPLLQLLNTVEVRLAGIHICPAFEAKNESGPDWEQRDEPFLQEAISLVGLMNLYHTRGCDSPKFCRPCAPKFCRPCGGTGIHTYAGSFARL